jgi:hypothetical protein
MAAKWTWTGMEEFKQALRNLPDELVAESDHIVEGSANAAAFEIRSAYGQHRHSGNLQASVVVEERKRSRVSVRYQVRAKAPHAHLFEFGTQVRHTKAGLTRGRMPPGNIFIPLYRKRLRRMFDELKALLQRKGLRVTGDA